MTTQEAEANGQTAAAVMSAARKNAQEIRDLDSRMKDALRRRVELIHRLQGAGMNYAQIGELYDLTKQRIFSILNPPEHAAR